MSVRIVARTLPAAKGDVGRPQLRARILIALRADDVMGTTTPSRIRVTARGRQ